MYFGMYWSHSFGAGLNSVALHSRSGLKAKQRRTIATVARPFVFSLFSTSLLFSFQLKSSFMQSSFGMFLRAFFCIFALFFYGQRTGCRNGRAARPPRWTRRPPGRSFNPCAGTRASSSGFGFVKMPRSSGAFACIRLFQLVEFCAGQFRLRLCR